MLGALWCGMTKENVYQDTDSGAWIAEYKNFANRWTLIGSYGSREAAITALARFSTQYWRAK